MDSGGPAAGHPTPRLEDKLSNLRGKLNPAATNQTGIPRDRLVKQTGVWHVGGATMPVEYKDYYKTLGVGRAATADEVRKSFRNLARKYHPDVAKDKASAEEKFKEINEAYKVLGDPVKRAKYDQLGADWNSQPPPGADSQPNRGRGDAGGAEFHYGGTGFSDFFEQFFGGFGGEPRATRGGGRGARNAEFSAKGGDVHGDLLATLHESLQGAVRSITLRMADPMTGKESEEAFRVKIPVGVQDGQLIRVAGKGEPGFGGGPAGDLYLKVRLAQHPDFKVKGADLYHELVLAPWEAVLGANIPVPTLEGSVTVRVAPGAAKGRQLRLKGHGLPNAKGERGDLYAVIQIETPAEVTEEERGLWRQLAAVSNFNPRR